jgi:hypothetical protein
VFEGLRQLEQVGQDDRVLPVPETTNRVTANNRVGISVVQQLKYNEIFLFYYKSEFSGQVII